MGVYFGTDGIRGIVNKDFDFYLAYCCGNALAKQMKNGKVLLGNDTRLSANLIKTSFICGVIDGGCDVIDVGLITTPGVSYLTQTEQCDFGVMITASHNPAEYNGIKIFNRFGEKIDNEFEDILEKNFLQNLHNSYDKLGNYSVKKYLKKKYENFLLSVNNYDLSNMKIVLDLDNGSGIRIAPKIFKKLGAKVFSINNKNEGENINKNCGALYPELLSKKVLQIGADLGFAYDGDADRLVVVDEKGNILDGDRILAIFSIFYKKNGMLKDNKVVYTNISNLGLDEYLTNLGINTCRVDIGDKFIIEELKKGGVLGGEKSGHFLLGNYLNTGDGILASIKLAEIVRDSKKKISQLGKFKSYYQISNNILVESKEKILFNDDVNICIEKCREKLKNEGRILFRASGTEPKIRLLIEGKDKKTVQEISNQIVEKISNYEK